MFTYLDDNDFKMLTDRIYKYLLSRSYTLSDFQDDEYRREIVDICNERIRDFVADEAVHDFGYKYGGLSGMGFDAVAEEMTDYLQTLFLAP